MASYLDWFDQPPNGQEPAEELSKWSGFDSLLHGIDLGQGEYVQKFIMKKYGVNSKEAEQIFFEAEKMYDGRNEKNRSHTSKIRDQIMTMFGKIIG